MDESKVVDDYGYSEDDYFEFLDTLRESGVVNMYGAGPYLMDVFGVPAEYARRILIRWMETFGERHAHEA